METGGLPEQEAREQAGGQQGDDERRHLPEKGEVGAGDAAEKKAALEAAGIPVAHAPAEVVPLVQERLKGRAAT